MSTKKFDPRVLRCKTPAECDSFIENARKLGREDLALEGEMMKLGLLAGKESPATELELAAAALVRVARRRGGAEAQILLPDFGDCQ
jgi:hypothetical protein